MIVARSRMLIPTLVCDATSQLDPGENSRL